MAQPDIHDQIFNNICCVAHKLLETLYGSTTNEMLNKVECLIYLAKIHPLFVSNTHSCTQQCDCNKFVSENNGALDPVHPQLYLDHTVIFLVEILNVLNSYIVVTM